MSTLIEIFNNDSKHYASKSVLFKAMRLNEGMTFTLPRGELTGEEGDFLLKMPCGEYTVICEKSFNLVFAELEIGDLLIMEPKNE